MYKSVQTYRSKEERCKGNKDKFIIITSRWREDARYLFIIYVFMCFGTFTMKNKTGVLVIHLFLHVFLSEKMAGQIRLSAPELPEGPALPGLASSPCSFISFRQTHCWLPLLPVLYSPGVVSFRQSRAPDQWESTSLTSSNPTLVRKTPKREAWTEHLLHILCPHLLACPWFLSFCFPLCANQVYTVKYQIHGNESEDWKTGKTEKLIKLKKGIVVHIPLVCLGHAWEYKVPKGNNRKGFKLTFLPFFWTLQ